MPRCNLTLKQKAQLIELSKELSTGQLAKKFRVHTTTVTRTIRKKDRILQQASRVNPNFKTVQTNQRSEEHDSMMLEYIRTQQEANKPISVSDICDKAVEYAEALGREIKSQRAWWRRFRVRCNVIKSKVVRGEEKPRVASKRRKKVELETMTEMVLVATEPDTGAATELAVAATTSGAADATGASTSSAEPMAVDADLNGEIKAEMLVVEVVEMLKDAVPEFGHSAGTESAVTIGPEGMPVELVIREADAQLASEVVEVNGSAVGERASNEKEGAANNGVDQPMEAKKDLIASGKPKTRGEKKTRQATKRTPRRTTTTMTTTATSTATAKEASPTKDDAVETAMAVDGEAATQATSAQADARKRTNKAKTNTTTRASSKPATTTTTIVTTTTTTKKADNLPVIPDKNFTFRIREPLTKGSAKSSDEIMADT